MLLPLGFTEFSAMACKNWTVIITVVRPKDEGALASKSKCHQFCYLFNICKVQCDSSLQATRQVELTMHHAMLIILQIFKTFYQMKHYKNDSEQ